MGLFHQQFFKTIFGFGSMWQLRISHLNFDVFLATNELVFNMLLRVWMLEEKHWTTQRQLETLFIHVAASQFLVPKKSFLWNDTPCKGVGLGELSPCSKLSKGPCMDLSLHVPNSYLRVVFNYLILTWELIVRFPMDPNTAYVLESRLIFYGWCNTNPDFGMWSDEMAQLKSLCLLVLQVWKFQSFLLSTKYFISAKKLQLLTHRLRPNCSGTKYLLYLGFAVIISMGLTRYGFISTTLLEDYLWLR